MERSDGSLRKRKEEEHEMRLITAAIEMKIKIAILSMTWKGNEKVYQNSKKSETYTSRCKQKEKV